MSHRARWIVVIIILVVVSTYAWVGNPVDPFDDSRFSREAWQRASAAYDLDSRAHMARDVTRRVIRPGMSETEVVDSLGRPETVTDRRAPGDAPVASGQIYRYHLGSWTFQRMDDAFLYVHFDANGRVFRTEIYGY
jgi:hypothetical protein